MHIEPDCIACIFNQALRVTKALELSPEDSKKLLDEAACMLPDFSLNVTLSEPIQVFIQTDSNAGPEIFLGTRKTEIQSQILTKRARKKSSSLGGLPVALRVEKWAALHLSAYGHRQLDIKAHALCAAEETECSVEASLRIQPLFYARHRGLPKEASAE